MWSRRWPELLLFSLSLGVRLLYWSRMPAEAMVPVDQVLESYLQALKDHFWEYLFYDHTQPPGMFLIHKVLLHLVGPGRAFVTWVPVPGFLLNSVAVVLVYSMARRVGAGRGFGWTMTMIYSLGLIPLELWHGGSTLDHYTVGLVACFAWAVMRRVAGSGFRQDGLVAITGAVLVLFQKVAFITTAVIILITTWLLEAPRARRWQRTAVALAGPLVVALALSAKNVLSVGSFLPSSLAGVNVAQFMWAAYGYDQDRLAAFARTSGAPDWYLWCYERAKRVEVMGPFYGTCYMQEGSPERAFDFIPLQACMEAHGERRVAQIVAADRARLSSRPYLRSFMVPEMSPRIAAEYSRISTHLFRIFVTRNPLLFLKQLLRTHYIYLVDGWRTLSLLLKDKSQQDIQLLPWLPWKEALLGASGLCGVLLLQGYLATYWLLLRLLWRWLPRWRRAEGGRRARSPAPLSTQERAMASAIAGVVVGSLAVNMACCENGRYFVQVSPYVIPLLALFTHVVMKGTLAAGAAPQSA